jgi:PAS domain S-box-containing protein
MNSMKVVGFFDHVCQIYDLPREMIETAADFLAADAARQARWMLLAGEEACRQILQLLQSRGVFAPDERCRGVDLPTLTADSLARLPAMLAAASRQARQDGYAGLRVVSDIAWLWPQTGDRTWLRNYQEALRATRGEHPFVVLNAYHRARCSAEQICAAIGCHPFVVQQDRVCRNFYCQPAVVQEAAATAEQDVGRRRDGSMRLYRRGQVLETFSRVAPVGLWMLNRDRRMVFANRYFCAAIGIDERQLLDARHYSEVVKGDAAVNGMLSDIRAFCADGPVEAEQCLVDADGRARYYRVIKTKVLDSEGAFEGLLGMALDISDRKRAEAGLKKSLRKVEQARDKVDNILHSIADGLVVTDAAQHVVLMNAAAEAMFGRDMASVKGRPVEQFCPDQELQKALQALPEAPREAPVEVAFQWSAPGRPGPRHIRARASVMLDHQQQANGAIIVFQDVTREKEIERSRTEFISMAAHELRTPLTSIMGFLEFCMNPEEFGGFSEAQQKEFMAEIYDKAELLSRIVSDLLDISRIDAGRSIPLDIWPVDLSEEAARVVRHFRDRFPRYHFELDFAAALCHEVAADREKLLQVLENLVGNAVKYSSEDSRIRLAGAPRAGVYRLSVSDEGIGMKPEQVDLMFERFYRAVDLNSGVRGLGLGMHIVKHIVEGHGGTIEVHSVPGEGTEIVLCLPLPGQDR